ncbi:M48 family metallopeptidase [uncultured Veillonella sp.]|uniref:tetratricopeptide repeat protein n=1 Tax=uncultured Veillonella sp. TaxID=159268 RepID=UPI00261CD28D|nr:tetratricopeptide repeat protein [uncultured Veillonella sp.]
MVILLSGCGGPTPSESEAVKPNSVVVTHEVPPAEVQTATELLQHNKYDEAIAKADEILKTYPKSDEAYAIKGMAQGLNGEVAAGLWNEQKAYELNPDNVSVYYNLAMLYKLQGDLNNSKEWFERVLQKDPRNVWSVYGIATIYADQGDDRMALVKLREAIALDEQVKSVARTQDHFVRFHGNPQFEAIVK